MTLKTWFWEATPDLPWNTVSMLSGCHYNLIYLNLVRFKICSKHGFESICDSSNWCFSKTWFWRGLTHPKAPKLCYILFMSRSLWMATFNFHECRRRCWVCQPWVFMVILHQKIPFTCIIFIEISYVVPCQCFKTVVIFNNFYHIFKVQTKDENEKDLNQVVICMILMLNVLHLL